jgi:hypothetical protein
MGSGLSSATSNFVLHSTAHRALEAELRDRHPEMLRQWKEMVEAWERDKTEPNPYISQQQRTFLRLALLCYLTLSGLTMTQLRAALAAQETAEPVSSSGGASSNTLLSPSEFIWEILSLERIRYE